MSVAEQPIKEDSELEEAGDKYMSDSSSNSQFSLRKRYLTLDRLIDKLQPLDSNSVTGSKYYGNVNETIEEELSDPDEDESRGFLSSHSSKQRKGSLLNSDEPVNPLSMKFFRDKVHRASKSMISLLDSETIAEELEEYDFQPTTRFQQRNHCFQVPSRVRTASDEEFKSEPA